MALVDIYNIQKKLDRYIVRIKESPEICDENKEHISKFFDYCFATGLGKVRIVIYAARLLPLAIMLGKDFKQATKEDLLAIVGKLEASNYSPHTKSIFRVTLKKFYKWLEGNGEDFPAKVKWIKTAVKHSEKLLPEQLLTQEDITKLIDAAENPMDKAFIAVLAESGARISELCGLKIKHVTFDQYGAQILIQSSKTAPRRVRLIQGVHYISYWLEHHMFKANVEAPLWITQNQDPNYRGKQTTYGSLNRRLQAVKQKAGINRPCNFHAFRHSRASELARLGLNQAALESYFGWTHGSESPMVYLHGNMSEDSLLKIYGVVKKEESNQKHKCPRCQKENELLSRFCKDCGMPLNITAGIEVETKQAELFRLLKPLFARLEKGETLDSIEKNTLTLEKG